MNNTQTIRPAAIAGSWYPGDEPALSAALEKFMAAATSLQHALSGTPPVPKAVIVPHAGYKYSGAIAARAYARIVPIADQITRVVLFGPAHRVYSKGLAIPSVEYFETPLGRVKLDQEYLHILKAQDYTEVSDAAHAEEHSLEIQIPFLQQVLGEFQLTPVVVGGASGEVVEDALKRLWGGAETLIVISSDLSHYHGYEESQRRDSATSMAIMSLSTGSIGSENACGWRPVDGLLRRAKNLGLTPTTLEVKNSGDTASPHDRVVGYGSWTFSHEIDASDLPLNEDNKRELLRIASTTIQRAAHGKPFPKVSVGTFSVPLQRPGASFVTLSKNGRLRGCLGSLSAYRPLVVDVAERGYASTIKDPRFKPLTPADLPGIHMEVAVLTAAQSMSFADETDMLGQLRPGTDGLIIQDQGKRATFLPKVWDDIRQPEQFLNRLRQKAGLDPNHWSATFQAWTYATDRFATVFDR